MWSPYDRENYSKYHAEKYVCYLGLWRYPHPEVYLHKRDPEDYRQRLIQLIEANKSRIDAAGRWETMFAKQALRDLERR